MRMLNMIKGDLYFFYKYGFFFVYAVILILYIVVLGVIPEPIKNKIGVILIYSDPAAMGLFFMGAIILLERSQRVLNTIAITPVKLSEYIGSKIIALSILGTVVSFPIAVLIHVNNYFLMIIGVILSSFLFSLIGLICAVKCKSLNQFVIYTVPAEIIFFVPTILYLFQVKFPYSGFHPGIAAIKLIEGIESNRLLSILVLLIWGLIAYLVTYTFTRKSFNEIGGVKL